MKRYPDTSRFPFSEDARRIARRDFLSRGASGFGALALSSLLVNRASASAIANPLAPKLPQFPAKAKSVIFLFMDGGPSQMETFDPKPRLRAEDGQKLPLDAPTQFPNSGLVMGSPMEFARHGECGAWVSELFPHTAKHVDDMTIVRSMHHDQISHAAGCYTMHTGHMLAGRPSMGAWVSYGLGTESENLPGFVVVNCGTIPSGGAQNFGNGFLPATHQGTIFKSGEHPIADVSPLENDPAVQKRKVDLIRLLDQSEVTQFGSTPGLDAAIDNFELAYRMQASVPELAEISGESEATRKLYGIDETDTEAFGSGCLMARRLVERGVRFIQVTTPDTGFNRWDQHTDLEKGLRANCKATDKPVAGLLRDLKVRGLLDETLVIWGGEFGRTPSAETKGGRDHNPYGFTMWMAGGGTQPGLTYGATDDYGYFAVENKVHVHDLHATMLHLLGIHHEHLTFRHAGRDFRLTDVYGNVVTDLLRS